MRNLLKLDNKIGEGRFRRHHETHDNQKFGLLWVILAYTYLVKVLVFITNIKERMY